MFIVLWEWSLWLVNLIFVSLRLGNRRIECLGFMKFYFFRFVRLWFVELIQTLCASAVCALRI